MIKFKKRSRFLRQTIDTNEKEAHALLQRTVSSPFLAVHDGLFILVFSGVTQLLIRDLQRYGAVVVLHRRARR